MNRSPIARPEFEYDVADSGHVADAARVLTRWERLVENTFARRLFILLLIGIAWEGYARWVHNPLIFPTLLDTLAALWNAAVHGPLLERTWTSIRVLLIGYSVGIFAAAVLTTLAVSSRIGTDFLTTLTAMFNPLPAIAMLPLALLWFGLGTPSVVFVILHSVLWAVSLNTLSGFQSVSETLRMAGQNTGLRGVRYVFHILIPAAFPSILTGLKIGWAFAWRTLIAAELVFGVTSRGGGLGWFIFENRTMLDTTNVFAGLVMVIIIGLLVESVIFRTVEARTVRRWGMQR